MSVIESWLASAIGRSINPDGHYGFQCVDVPDDYAEAIFGVPWRESVGGVAGARQLLDAAPDKFWTRIDYAHGLVPQRGDVLVFAGDKYNEWGHTAVVESADQIGMNVVQQDGFAPPHQFVDGNWYSAKPAHRARLAYRADGTGPLAGWLRPRPEKIIAGSMSYASESITPLEEEDVANTQDELQEAVQKVLRDNPLVIGGRSVAAGVNQALLGIDVVNDNIAKLKVFVAQHLAPAADVKDESTTYYLKGDKKPEVYALDVASGKLRHVQSAEFDVVNSIGIYKTVPQARVDALLEAK